MKKIVMIYPAYLTNDRTRIRTGGIQTYLSALCGVVSPLGFASVLYQCAPEDFVLRHEGAEIHGLAVPERSLAARALRELSGEEIVIFGSHELTVPYRGRSVAIQHGVTWDKPSARSRNIPESAFIFHRAWQASRRLAPLRSLDALVCVDRNFVNWYRTQVGHPAVACRVIPNFTHIAPPAPKPEGDLRIIFARRFFPYRGTRIFAEAIARLLTEYDGLFVTLAGEGPDEEWLRERLGGFHNVEFIRYAPQDSLKIHENQHIAVIPTIGSEGTSLSLLEAMSAGCAVVCTDVGGMTDVVLDGYNGLMISPSYEVLYLALRRLIGDEALRRTLALRARETVAGAFSYERWAERWSDLLSDLADADGGSTL